MRARARRCFVILNRFPYTSGHLMVLPNRAVADLEDLDDDEYAELWALVRDAVVALKAALRCDGGQRRRQPGRGRRAAPRPTTCTCTACPAGSATRTSWRWSAESRVLPVSLDEAWERLRDAWPAAGRVACAPSDRRRP